MQVGWLLQQGWSMPPQPVQVPPAPPIIRPVQVVPGARQPFWPSQQGSLSWPQVAHMPGLPAPAPTQPRGAMQALAAPP
jgi:hypothetical protein